MVVAKLDPSAEWHRQIEQLVEALPDAIIVIDGAGAVQFVNGAAQMLFGEAVTLQRWIGIGFIVLGVWLVARSA